MVTKHLSFLKLILEFRQHWFNNQHFIFYELVVHSVFCSDLVWYFRTEAGRDPDNDLVQWFQDFSWSFRTSGGFLRFSHPNFSLLIYTDKDTK